MKNTIAICALSALLAGCAATSGGVQVRQEQLTGFQEGITSEADVIQALGRPNASTASSDGTKTLIYSFAQYKIKGATFVPIVGLFAGGTDMQMNSTIFRFGKDGKMLSYQTTESGHSTGFGAQRAETGKP